MDIQEVISRINYLYHKSQKEELDSKEIEEQKELRKIYINNIKNNFRVQLDGIKNNNIKE